MNSKYLNERDVYDSFKIGRKEIFSLLASQKIKAYFSFAGVLQESFFAKLTYEFHLEMNDQEVDPEEFYGTREFDFSGYITVFDGFSTSRLLQSNNSSKIFSQDATVAECINYKQLPSNYEDSMRFCGEDITYIKCGESTKYKILKNQNPIDSNCYGAEFSSEDCLFRRTELEAYFHFPAPVVLIPAVVNVQVENEQVVDNVLMPTPPNKQVKRTRTNDIRSLISRSLYDKPEITVEELWQGFLAHAKAKKSIFTGVTENNELIYKDGKDDLKNQFLSFDNFKKRVNRFKKTMHPTPTINI
jgi:hypothetical protein